VLILQEQGSTDSYLLEFLHECRFGHEALAAKHFLAGGIPQRVYNPVPTVTTFAAHAEEGESLFEVTLPERAAIDFAYLSDSARGTQAHSSR